MGPFDEPISWQTEGLIGMKRFLEKVWKLSDRAKEIIPAKEDQEIERILHKTIKKVTEDIENFRFNTAISALMILVNKLQNKNYGIWHLKSLLLLLAPFAPHICEELWRTLNPKPYTLKASIHSQPWPKYDPKLIEEEIITLVIQVNGKVRDKIEVEADISEEKAKELAISREKIKKWLEDKKIKKVVFVPGKLINIVI
jgi:leucyl-tRNA synthetase